MRISISLSYPARGRLASDAVLDVAYGWLCHRRRDYPADADVWSFRRHWPGEKRRIQADLFAGDFRFGLLDRITLKDGSDIDLWSARDALVLKALAIVLSDILPVSPRCTHVRDHGGAKAAVRDNLQESAVAEKLASVTEIDFDSAIETVSEAEDADLPLGFGRD